MLEDFLLKNKINGKVIEFKDNVETTVAAARKAGVSIDCIVKSVLFVSNGLGVLVILLGSEKVNVKKLREILMDEKIKLASSAEVEEITGFEVGAVPPLSVYGIKVILDEKVLEKNKVLAGGGALNKLLEIDSKELLKALQESNEDLLITRMTGE